MKLMNEIEIKFLLAAHFVFAFVLLWPSECTKCHGREARWMLAGKVCSRSLLSSVFCSCSPDIGFGFVFVAFFKFPPPWPAALHMLKDPSLFSGFYKDRIWTVCAGIFARQLTVFSASVSSPAGLKGRILLNKCTRIYGCKHSDADRALISFGWRTSAWRSGFKPTTHWTV